jgi:hypothetical protein
MEPLNLRETPELHISAPGAAEKITEKLTVELRRVLEDPGVVAAHEALEEVEGILNKNNLAWSRLNTRVLDLGKFLGNVAGAYIDSLIESATDNGKRPDQKIGTQVVNAENEHRLNLRAIASIVEHRLPKLEIAKLWREAGLERAKADVFDRFAEERAQRLIAAMGAAIAEEVVLPVDTKSGVAGMLIGLANEARKNAYTRETQAKELQSKYDERNRKGN